MTIAWGKFLFYSKIMLLLRNVKMNLKVGKPCYTCFMVWYGMVWRGGAILLSEISLYRSKGNRFYFNSGI